MRAGQLHLPEPNDTLVYQDGVSLQSGMEMKMALRFLVLLAIPLAAASCLEPPKGSGTADVPGRQEDAQDGTGRGVDALGDGSGPGTDGACIPACNGLECGPDSCGGSCGDCDEPLFCFYGQCVELGTECLDPNVNDRNDGCHGGRISDYQVNTHVTGDQFAPVVTSMAEGEYVVAWSSCPFRDNPEGTDEFAQDGSACGVFLRPFTQDGSPQVSIDLPATAATTGAQWSPGMGPANDGFVLAWNSEGQDGWRTWFRIWNWDALEGQWEATPAAEDIQAALRNVDSASLVAAASGDSAHDFVVAWEGDLPDGGTGILARHFGRDTKVFETILEDDQDMVLGSGYNDVDAPAAVGLNSNLYAVLWEALPKEDPLKPDQGSDVFGIVRRYDGQPLETAGPYAAPFALHKSWLGGQRTPSGVSDDYGNSLVVAFAGTSDEGILVRRFVIAEASAVPESSISAQPDFEPISPQITRLTDGRFVVVWQTNGMEDDPSGAIFARILGADLKPQGAPVHVNSYTFDWQQKPQVAALPAGGFVVVWESCCHQDGSGWGVFAKRFDSGATPVPFTSAQGR